MLLEAIYHRPKNNFAYTYNKSTIHIRVRTKKDDVQAVQLLHGDKYDWDNLSSLTDMQKVATDDLFDWWQTEITPPFRRLRYGFRFQEGEEEIWMTEEGFQVNQPKDPLRLFDFPFINPIDVFEAPAWVKDAIFYQIFPERFANGDRSNDPEKIEDWETGSPAWNNYFGGDLQGVIDHIDHLSKLGINAIYFTPLFEANTNHKYDTKNYLQVDPHFGDNAKLKELVQKCHSVGIKVLLDAVFNHSGFHFEPFQDVLQNGEASPYKDWFHLREFPIQTEPRPNYDAFAFESRMPKLNTENPELKAYLLEVARYWIEEVGIDGWRLDVANEVDHQFWREFRKVVKEANPEAYILGEIWHDSMPWLQGDQFDAVMNYPFTNAVLDFFAKRETTATHFRNQINKVNMNYPLQINEVAFNLLDSHDTPRLLHVCQEDKGRLQLALLFQLTYLGTPCIYYGDEVGMTGAGDPDCRRPMIWDEERQDHELFAYYQTLINLRKQYSALRTGSFRFLENNNESVVAYERVDAEAHFVIILNNQEVETSILMNDYDAENWETVLSTGNQQGNTVTLPANGYIILKK